MRGCAFIAVPGHLLRQTFLDLGAAPAAEHEFHLVAAKTAEGRQDFGSASPAARIHFFFAPSKGAPRGRAPRSPSHESNGRAPQTTTPLHWRCRPAVGQDCRVRLLKRGSHDVHERWFFAKPTCQHRRRPERRSLRPTGEASLRGILVSGSEPLGQARMLAGDCGAL